MAGNNPQAHLGDRLIDVAVTLSCWVYFIFAFLFFFSFFYIAAWLFAADRERAFQYLNHLFYKGFFTLLRTLAPRQEWNIDPQVAKIRGSIIVCNHLSYLDPLILISLLRQNKTIVKTKFFQAPVFGWLIKVSGYLPATTEGVYAKRMIDQVENMGEFLKNGGNLFVFPEGTRSPGAVIGDFHKGGFKIARMYRCPIQVLSLCNTDKLFTPGRFFFNSRQHNTISLGILGRIEPPQGNEVISADSLEKSVRRIFDNRETSCHGEET
ncbi:MAG: 1-acyl-sn-glycerol-3-phosphate acyltransferase [Desulfocapsa sp.]|nr:1-acyl-sn-glycerol-3-phosphate acyltransferase [Desulfocapsa sp.]